MRVYRNLSLLMVIKIPIKDLTRRELSDIKSSELYTCIIRDSKRFKFKHITRTLQVKTDIGSFELRRA